MTLQEAKDKVAKKHGYENWQYACFVWAGWVQQVQPFMDEAAELYSKAKWEQACEEQKRICAHSANAIVFMGTGVVHKESILQARTPEFKP